MNKTWVADTINHYDNMIIMNKKWIDILNLKPA